MNSISDSKPSVIGLIDPDKKNHNLIKNQLRYINENDFCSVLVGGSLLMDSNFDDRINYISSKTNLPLISFPSFLAAIVVAT